MEKETDQLDTSRDDDSPKSTPRTESPCRQTRQHSLSFQTNDETVVELDPVSDVSQEKITSKESKSGKHNVQGPLKYHRSAQRKSQKSKTLPVEITPELPRARVFRHSNHIGIGFSDASTQAAVSTKWQQRLRHHMFIIRSRLQTLRLLGLFVKIMTRFMYHHCEARFGTNDEDFGVITYWLQRFRQAHPTKLARQPWMQEYVPVIVYCKKIWCSISQECARRTTKYCNTNPRWAFASRLAIGDGVWHTSANTVGVPR